MISLLLMSSCGLKSNPVSSTIDSWKGDESVLSAYVKDGAVELTWTSAKMVCSHVRIEKSELGSISDVCHECPKSYRIIADLASRREGRYRDFSIEKGKRYEYRLECCEESGMCHLSRATQVDFK